MIQSHLNSETWERYEIYPSFVLGFHGCDREIGEAVINREISNLDPSRNDYDWLGEGVYFWESNPARALDFARERAQGGLNSRGEIRDPFVVGAILDLGHCFSTTEMTALQQLTRAYRTLQRNSEKSGEPLPSNGPTFKTRRLDCAAFNLMHTLAALEGRVPYDTIRAAFSEGGELFSGSGFRQADHTQICVRNLDCVLGYFSPL